MGKRKVTYETLIDAADLLEQETHVPLGFGDRGEFADARSKFGAVLLRYFAEVLNRVLAGELPESVPEPDPPTVDPRQSPTMLA